MLASCAGAISLAAQPVGPQFVEFQVSEATGPAPTGAAWRHIDLPHTTERSPAVWYRVAFDAPDVASDTWAVYLPYLYGGGRLLLNGTSLARITGSGDGNLVRWERPFLIPIPDALLQPGPNILLVQPLAEPVNKRIRMPFLLIGPQAKLLAEYERRRFWVRTMPQFTVVACLIVGLMVLLIWWRRREELLYGLFGIAALLWGGRTMTFIIEVLPAEWWPLWRLFYHSATGGFIIVLLVFSLRLAGSRLPWLERALLCFWLLGPIGYVVSGGSENLIGRVWSGGLIPIGLGVLVMSAVAAWRQRTWALVALSTAIALAVAAGIHDYLMAGSSSLLQTLAPQWTADRIFMLHYAADLLLLVMGGILSARFVAALQELEELNRTLESRVAEREQALTEKHAQLGLLERQHAAAEERQRIMRDLHDGLGSQLFVTLSRVEANQIKQGEIAQSLRDCIADMRLALDAMNPDSNDFLEAWGSFRFRWERQLETAGLQSSWKADVEGGVLNLTPQAGLQLLRIAQEALTNVLKHASAHQVRIELQTRSGRVCLNVFDNGRSIAEAVSPGRGLANMRTRALRLGAQLKIEPANPGTRVCLEFDQTPAAYPASTVDAG